MTHISNSSGSIFGELDLKRNDVLELNQSKKMFVNKRMSSSRNRDHKNDEVILKVSEALKTLELQPQCRLLWQVCDIDCCLYQCMQCLRNAFMVPILQNCLKQLIEIQERPKE